MFQLIPWSLSKPKPWPWEVFKKTENALISVPDLGAGEEQILHHNAENAGPASGPL